MSMVSLLSSSWTNQRLVFRSRDLSGPIRGHYSCHVIRLDQSEATITCLTPALTVRMRRVSHGGLGAGAQLRVLLDAGQLGGRLEEVVHRVLALQGRDL